MKVYYFHPIAIFTAAAALLLASCAVALEDRDWRAEGDQRISDIKKQFKYISTNEARNVILFIADGNGVNTNYGTRLYQGQLEGGYGEEFVLSHEKMPWSAMVKTYNTNGQTPDSAGTATAMNSGHKTKSGLIGVSEAVPRGDCSAIPGNELTLIAQEASRELNKKVGVVTTARVTHATPAAVYARTADRDYESSVPEGCTEQVDIAQQLIAAMTGEDAWVDFAAGGGKRSFYNSTEVDRFGDAGDRTDGLDLLQKAADINVQIAETRDEFLDIDCTTGDGKVLGVFSSSHLDYDLDRLADDAIDQPSIMEMTKAAIEFLSHNDDGFYLMVEAGRVDHANHASNLHRTFQDGMAYQDAVAYAMNSTDPEETLILSTADHGHTIAMNGYCGRGSPVTGLCYEIDPSGTEHLSTSNVGTDGSTYTVISVGNGPGSILYEAGPNFANVSDEGIVMRPNVTNDEAMDIDYIQQSLVPLSSETHSGTDVVLYCQGPWSHLCVGTVEQTHIFDVMWYAMTHG